VLPALTGLATSTLPPARFGTGIGVQSTFRQMGAALGLAAFVALGAGGTLSTKSDFDDAWLFMAVVSASTTLLFVPLLHTRPESVVVETAIPTEHD
jgi:hypothetical protein